MSWQTNQPCAACGTVAVDRCFHHIYTRKARPDLIDCSFNKIALCSRHHAECHQIGLIKFSEKYATVKKWLIKNEWELTDKWRHYGAYCNGSD